MRRREGSGEGKKKTKNCRLSRQAEPAETTLIPAEGRNREVFCNPEVLRAVEVQAILVRLEPMAVQRHRRHTTGLCQQ